MSRKFFVAFLVVLFTVNSTAHSTVALAATPTCTGNQKNPTFIFSPNVGDSTNPKITLSQPFTITVDGVGDSNYTLQISDRIDDTAGNVLNRTDLKALGADGRPINSPDGVVVGQKSKNGRVTFSINPTAWVIDQSRDYYVSIWNTLTSPPSQCTPVKINFTTGLTEQKTSLPPPSGPPPGTPGYTAPQTPTGECDFDIKTALSFLNPFKLIPCLIKGIVGAIALALLTFATAFVVFAIEINKSITDPHSLAKFGFDISLQITNILFAAGIIAIAFGTMLRRSFGLNLLPRFFIIAILINFSFWAVTKVVAISDTVTLVFLGGSYNSLDWGTLSRALSGFEGPTSLGGALGATIQNWAGIFVSIAFTFVSTITIIAVAVMFFIRYVYLTLLIILLPFALFFSIFPGLKVGGASSLWDRWTENFTRWVIFGPVMAFFLFLSFTLLASYKPTTSDQFAAKLGQTADLIAFIFFLLIGLQVANALGVNGAAAFNNAARGGIARGRNWATSNARKLAVSKASERFRGEKGELAAARLQQLRLAKIPVGRMLGLGKAASALGVAGEKLVAEEGKGFGGWTDRRLAAMAPALHGGERIAVLTELKKRRKLDNVTDLGAVLNDGVKREIEATGQSYSDYERQLPMGLSAYKKLKDFHEGRVTMEEVIAEQQKFMAEFPREALATAPWDKMYAKDHNVKNDKGEEEWAPNRAFGLDKDQFEEMRTIFTAGIIANSNYIPRIAPKIRPERYEIFIKSVVEQVVKGDISNIEGTATIALAEVLKNPVRYREEIKRYLEGRGQQDLSRVLFKTMNERLTGTDFETLFQQRAAEQAGTPTT